MGESVTSVSTMIDLKDSADAPARVSQFIITGGM